MNQTKALVISIKPKFADRIFQGEKKVELRRVKPKIRRGDKVIIYVSSPVKSVKAIFTVGNVIEDRPEKLWETIKNEAGVTKDEFEAYFLGAKKGVAIKINDINMLTSPLELSEIQEIFPNFLPPQSYKYFSDEDLTTFLNTISE